MHWSSFSTRARVALFLLAIGAGGSLMAFRGQPADDTEVLRRLVLGVRNFYEKNWPETVYLHLDKDVYTTGETVWMRAYVADAARHQLDTISKVLHVELVSDQQQVVSRRTLQLTNGLGTADLALADTLAPGTYLLRAYTGWMRNASPDFFYSRRLQVWPATAPATVPDTRTDFRRITERAQRRQARVSLPPDVQFFPEGGSLVAGLDNVVAFKAVDYGGASLDVAGQVLDEHNQPVASFQSQHAGMGTLHFTPAAGQQYRAVFSTPALAKLRVPLPAVQASGYSMQVITTADQFIVNIRQQGGAGGPVLLLGQVGYSVGYLGRGELRGQETFTAHIPKRKFASGVVHLTLFDGQGRPLAERLAFARNEAPLHVSLTPDQPAYGPHQPVRIQVAVTDADGHPVATDLSLAVADAAATSAVADNIAARLLLTTDLAGYVENPGYYFENPTAETDRALDDLLLTQGWRRFTWPTVLAEKLPAPEFGAERSPGLLGQITRPNGTPVPHSVLTLLQSKPERRLLTVEANNEGWFLLNGLGGCDSIQGTLQARTAKGGGNLVINLDNTPPLPKQALPLLPSSPAPTVAAAIGHSQAQYSDEQQFHLANTVALGTVHVRGQRVVAPDSRRIYSPAFATVVEMKNIAGSANFTLLQSLQSRLPGVSITGSEPNMSVRIRGITSLMGDGDPLVLLDGTMVTLDALAFYPAFNVERVEILKGGQAAIFGSQGANGVLAVYTRMGDPNYDHRLDKVPGMLGLRQAAYNCPRQFYAPRYGAGAPAPTRPDTRRSTLYWNPALRTDASGQTTFTFYTSGATGSFQLSAEGISANGQPALGKSSLEVK